ncbi:MAG: type II toxin-antitoxin system VapC family toxin [Deltaproteobacteria bacterium]|nr:type II toxin-antitoxin system VapC family toxin [Deltaproteobacteria bacterium]
MVFVDTSGAYALLDGTDAIHPAVKNAFLRAEHEHHSLLTTSYVLHESWALIQARLGWEALNAWHDKLVPKLDVIWVDERLHALGAARCRQARERRLSLTDCISLEVMHARGIETFIGADEHFERDGFRPY